MKIQLFGAAGEVTGSSYYVETPEARVLVDFGMFQGNRATERKNRMPRDLPVARLDAVVLTHAHLDHTGRLPLLVRRGYRGPIYATPATIKLTLLVLRDAARLQEADADRENRKRKRAGKPSIEPLFTVRDVARLIDLFKPLPYNTPREVATGVQVRLVDAGHILGSASIEMILRSENKTKTVVFSGDLGPRGAPILRDPVPFDKADLVFLESTYGDHDHRSLSATLEECYEALNHAVYKRGKMLVPAFAIGRTQSLLYTLGGAFDQGIVERFPIYLDSPMAIDATEIYEDHVELFDEEALALLKSGHLRRNLDSVYYCPTVEDSRGLNSVSGPCLIMAGSGMCTGGRILHHLRHNLANPATTVILVGYQGAGTLGRQLVEKRRTVRIFRESVPVRATIYTIGGFSAHAGQTELLEWFSSLAPSRPQVVLTHGEDRGRRPLADLIRRRYGLRAELPNLNARIEL